MMQMLRDKNIGKASSYLSRVIFLSETDTHKCGKTTYAEALTLEDPPHNDDVSRAYLHEQSHP